MKKILKFFFKICIFSLLLLGFEKIKSFYFVQRIFDKMLRLVSFLDRKTFRENIVLPILALSSSFLLDFLLGLFSVKFLPEFSLGPRKLSIYLPKKLEELEKYEFVQFDYVKNIKWLKKYRILEECYVILALEYPEEISVNTKFLESIYTVENKKNSSTLFEKQIIHVRKEYKLYLNLNNMGSSKIENKFDIGFNMKRPVETCFIDFKLEIIKKDKNNIYNCIYFFILWIIIYFNDVKKDNIKVIGEEN
ncbi:MAG: hypothetical protein JW924_11860 [Fusobacteriaceae bacterium]|nr:hypothetical protein [Fusobacteriaceae bacterium]